MDIHDDSEYSDWDIDRIKTEKDLNVQWLKEQIIEHRDFIFEIHNSAFWKGAFVDNTERILISVSKTLDSIRHCLISVNIADMFTLLRKCRDDLFFYILVKVVHEKHDSDGNDEMKVKISDWENNRLKDLDASCVLKYIGSYKPVLAAITKYGIRKEFDDMGTVLNNYVHSNGIVYYNQFYDKYNDAFNVGRSNVLKGILDDFEYQMNYLFASFIFLYILIRPSDISSDDYVDSLDCGQKPIIGSQYWGLPFVNDYLMKYQDYLGKGCKQYLKDETGMEIE